MDLNDITTNLTNRENWRIERQLDDLVRHNPKYKHLSGGNRETIFNLVKKYKEKIRRGQSPSWTTVRDDKYYLYQNRFKLGLSPEDLAKINKLLDSFKRK